MNSLAIVIQRGTQVYMNSPSTAVLLTGSSLFEASGRQAVIAMHHTYETDPSV